MFLKSYCNCGIDILKFTLYFLLCISNNIFNSLSVVIKICNSCTMLKNILTDIFVTFSKIGTLVFQNYSTADEFVSFYILVLVSVHVSIFANC